MRLRLNIVSQLLRDNGFDDVSPMLFLKFSRSDWIVLVRFIRDDLEVALSPYQRGLVMRQLTSLDGLSTHEVRNQASRMVFAMLMDARDPYILAYTLMAAIHKL